MRNSKKWEYKDLVYPLPKGEIWANCGRQGYPDIVGELLSPPHVQEKRPDQGYTIDQAKEMFWREFMHEIKPEVQKWMDDGWEAGDEIGPSGIAVRTYKSFKPFPLARPFLIAISVVFLGLPLLWRSTIAEPFEFRLLMRRPKPVKKTGL